MERNLDNQSNNLHFPPELLKIFGGFTVFIVSSFLTYLGLIDYLHGFSIPTGEVPMSYNNSPSFSLESFLPYTVFIGLVGFGLSFSTKDLLENYFAGISLKIDTSFEEGDRIVIGNSGMLEVKEIGIRTSKFYDIKNNSIINIPHKEISKKTINNYTHPTLDYRREISFTFSIETNIHEIEGLLLAATFLTDGVKLPKINNNNVRESGVNSNNTNFDDISNEDKEIYYKYSFIEKINSIQDPAAFDEVIKRLYNELDSTDKLIEELKNQNNLNGNFELKNVLLVTKDSNCIDLINKLKTSTININYIYFKIAKILWNSKKPELSVSAHRKIDSVAINLLNAPRIQSRQVFNGTHHWEVSLAVTLELSEQSDEVIHHINLITNALLTQRE